ncbi:MAG: Maf family protein [Pseudohongiella sp.]|nr:Maf family protein [Pseudohongiella sp.]MDP2126134.1 Maf family protein [Pseudohongiella sp.]
MQPAAHSSALQTLVLASASPRRRELLEQIGVQFEVIVHDVDETRLSAEPAYDYVCRLAQAKAAAVESVEKEAAGRPVLGADTIVVVENQVLGKPRDAADAERMLKLLSGCEHRVISAVCVMQRERCGVRVSTTKVRFRVLSQQDIDAYWQSGEPLGKAGGYAVQGLGALFIDYLEGSYSGVVGLPLFETAELLREFSVPTALSSSARLFADAPSAETGAN